MARKPGSKAPVTLPAAFTIAEVGAVSAECQRAVSAGGAVRIEAGAVERIDTAGLQLLAALVAAARRASLPCEWSEPSEALTSAARQLGLTSPLELPTAAG